MNKFNSEVQGHSFFSVEALAERNPAAYEALPETYQNDSCLAFYILESELRAKWDLGGTFAYRFMRNWGWIQIGFDCVPNPFFSSENPDAFIEG